MISNVIYTEARIIGEEMAAGPSGDLNVQGHFRFI